jgi:hypothetical protein
MTVMLRRKGKELGADFPAWAKSLDPAQTAWLWNVLNACIEAQDSTIVLQLYVAAINHWEHDFNDRQRANGAEEGEHRFFTVEALERDERERKDAMQVVEGYEEGGPPASNRPNSNIVMPGDDEWPDRFK